MPARAQDSRAGIIEAHLPLVRAIARRYAHRGEPLEDLVQAGTIGLIKAVDRYDAGRHPNLAALARPAIEGEIRHHLRDAGPGAHVPRTDRELAARVRATSGDLTAQLQRNPTMSEIAEEAGVDERLAAAALRVREAERPLPFEGDPEPRAAGRRGDDLEAAEARVLLAAGWPLLDERERRMLELRYHEDRSQAEIARELGLSQAHVSRLLRGALERLRAALHAGEEAGAAQAHEPRPGGRNGRLLLRVPRSLHDELATAAQREGVPLNTYVAGKLSAAVCREAPPAPPESRRGLLLVLNAIVIALAALAGLALVLQGLLG
jgi:RNA polymerase sigma-B factor